MDVSIIPKVMELIVGQSARIAIEGVAKLATPAGLKTGASYGVKMGAGLLAMFISHKLTTYTTEKVEEIVEIVKTPSDVLVVQEIKVEPDAEESAEKDD